MKMMKIGGIVGTVLLLFSTFALLFGHRSESPLLFNAAVWKDQLDSNERLRMVSDLKPKLMGISKAEVEKLLGTPRKDVSNLAPSDYFYLLGTKERLLDDDGVWLCIKIEHDRVSSVQVVHD